MMKTEKRRANVGERILITKPCMNSGYYELGDILTVATSIDNIVIAENITRWIRHEEYEVIVETPKKSARITALETQVAEQRDELVALQAKVEALESAGKYPLTAKFERDSAEVDGILADIERKAKPTLEALLATYPAVKSPNEQRADVIKRAKAFVTENTKPNSSNDLTSVVFGIRMCTTEFHVNTEKRVVTFLAKGKHTRDIHAKGIAKCDPDDVFNADIGKAIALARALGVEVPVEFVKAVQPTQVVVGMRNRMTYFDSDVPYVSEVKAFEGSRVRYACGAFDMRSDVDKEAVILDDTDAVYE